MCSVTSRRTLSSGMLRAFATRGTWNRAAAGEMSGSSPLPDVVTRSMGTGVAGIFLLELVHVALTRSISTCSSGRGWSRWT